MCDATLEGAFKCCLLLPEFGLAWIQHTLDAKVYAVPKTLCYLLYLCCSVHKCGVMRQCRDGMLGTRIPAPSICI